MTIYDIKTKIFFEASDHLLQLFFFFSIVINVSLVNYKKNTF